MQGSHRKTSPQKTLHLLRLSLIASAGLAAIAGTTPATAMASTPQSVGPATTLLPGVHVDHTSAVSTASPLKTSDHRVAFDIYEYGDTVGAGADNRAIAGAHSCTGDEHCRSVAFSFQIITMGGSHLQLHARNSSRATNVHCTGCQTVAGAYQFILDTPEPITLDATALAQLDRIHQALEAAARSESADTLKATADTLAEQVVAILHNAALHASRPAAARAGFLAAPAFPNVTVNRVVDGGPATP